MVKLVKLAVGIHWLPLILNLLYISSSHQVLAKGASDSGNNVISVNNSLVFCFPQSSGDGGSALGNPCTVVNSSQDILDLINATTDCQGSIGYKIINGTTCTHWVCRSASSPCYCRENQVGRCDSSNGNTNSSTGSTGSGSTGSGSTGSGSGSTDSGSTGSGSTGSGSTGSGSTGSGSTGSGSTGSGSTGSGSTGSGSTGSGSTGSGITGSGSTGSGSTGSGTTGSSSKVTPAVEVGGSVVVVAVLASAAGAAIAWQRRKTARTPTQLTQVEGGTNPTQVPNGLEGITMDSKSLALSRSVQRFSGFDNQEKKDMPIDEEVHTRSGSDSKSLSTLVAEIKNQPLGVISENSPVR
eukprot:TRINITY_DN2974_c0_g1_i3.p1 TRINITY_DN2974_c0_g1~~TRINITY_DN2974_c0_g1_i3.p1  ORF type:complete len:353 (-),score=50.98 TRINITY_DN2974_c0_g1_i3:41-1099(-)